MANGFVCVRFILRPDNYPRSLWFSRVADGFVVRQTAIMDEDVYVKVEHPHGDIWVPISMWMERGPGPRPYVRPTEARDERTGHPLVLREVLPLAYRNDEESRALIAGGTLADPWAHKRDEWAAAMR